MIHSAGSRQRSEGGWVERVPFSEAGLHPTSVPSFKLHRNLVEQDGDECGEVLHDTVMGHLEYGCMAVAIDGYDGLCGPHA
jgi:hypothetical protein